MDNLLISVLTQLAGQTPVLIAYLLGIILAVAFWRRCPGPCAFTLAATALLLLTAIGQSFLSMYFIHARSDWSPERLCCRLQEILRRSAVPGASGVRLFATEPEYCTIESYSRI